MKALKRMNTPASLRRSALRRSGGIARIPGLLLICLSATSQVAFAATSDGESAQYTIVPDTFVYCTTCHGVEFRGNSFVDAPRLNGMEDWYLRNQMRAFAGGWRGTHSADLIGMEMQPQAAALTEKQLEAAVQFVASVPVRLTTLSFTVQGDENRGADLYLTCAACHGAGGEGNATLQAPRLAGQSDWYLVRQLEKYIAGSRGHEPQDTLGTQMRAATAVLSSADDVLDVVAYINTLTKELSQPSEENP